MDIYARPDYISYQWSFNFPTATVIVSIFYMIPTIYLICLMLVKYLKELNKKSSPLIQPQLFSSFLMMQIANLFYFLTDNMVIRLPATGLFTSICANIPPNHYFKIIYVLAFISDYLSILFPVLLCLNRAIIVFRIKDHSIICRKVFKIFVPISFIIPICLTSFMIPSMGYCAQITEPYSFGSIMIGIYSKAKINEFAHLLTSILCTIFTFSINITIFIKVRHILFRKTFSSRQTMKNYKAELSLTITMISLFTPFLINGIIVVIVLTDPRKVGYILAFRPLAIDTATCLISWTFYLTHPVFQTFKVRSSSSPMVMTLNSSTNRH